MSNYLAGSFPVKDEEPDANGLATAHLQEGCYAYLTKISVDTQHPIFYTMQFDVFSDASNQNNIFSISGVLLPVIADETDDDRQLRALERFQLNYAQRMSVVTEEPVAS